MDNSIAKTEAMLKYQTDLEAYARFLFEQEMEREKSITTRASGMITVLSLSLAAISAPLGFLTRILPGMKHVLFLLMAGEGVVSFLGCLFFSIRAQTWSSIQWFESAEAWEKSLEQEKNVLSDEIIRHRRLFQAYRDVQKSVEQCNNARRKMLSWSIWMYALFLYFFLMAVGTVLVYAVSGIHISLPCTVLCCLLIHVGIIIILFILWRSERHIYRRRDSHVNDDARTGEPTARDSSECH